MSNHDPVNSPAHYQSESGLEAIDVIIAFLGTEGAYNYCRGNALKYELRAGAKNDAAEDHRKAAWYASKAAELQEKIDEGPQNELSLRERVIVDLVTHVNGGLARNDVEIFAETASLNRYRLQPNGKWQLLDSLHKEEYDHFGYLDGFIDKAWGVPKARKWGSLIRG